MKTVGWMVNEMREAQEGDKFEAVVRRIDPRGKLLRTWPLTGGVSAQMTALELRLADGQTKRMVVRRHGQIDRSRNPHIAAAEFKLLQILQAAGLAVPTPYYLDQTDQIFDIPYLVIEYIDGKPEFAPANLTDLILQIATYLSRIHRVDCSQAELSFLAEQQKGFGARPAALDDSLDEGHIRDVLESIWPLPRLNAPVLLHGDFWPGNILWQDGRLVAVVDWEDAKSGDPLADVANARLEMLWAFGLEAMDRFTRHYQPLMATVNFSHLPYWDLCAALRPASKLSTWGLDDATEQAMRAGHRLFITQAFEKLAR